MLLDCLLGKLPCNGVMNCLYGHDKIYFIRISYLFTLTTMNMLKKTKTFSLNNGSLGHVFPRDSNTNQSAIFEANVTPLKVKTEKENLI